MVSSVFNRNIERLEQLERVDLTKRALFRDGKAAFATSTDDAFTLSLSSPENVARRNKGAAFTALSDATSLSNVAEATTTNVDSLLSQLKTTTQALASETSESRKASLKSELDTLLGQIDSTVQGATFNESAVVDAGSVTVSVNLDASDSSSSTSAAITVPNIPLSRSSLGLNSFDSSTIATDTEAFITAVDKATLQVGDTKTALDNTQGQIETVAAAFGIRGANTAESAQSASTVQNPEALADSLAESLRLTLIDLNPTVNVQLASDLLLSDAKKFESSPTATTATTTSDKLFDQTTVTNPTTAN